MSIEAVRLAFEVGIGALSLLRCLGRICGGVSGERIGALRARGWHEELYCKQ